MRDLWRTIAAGFLTMLLLLSFVSTGAAPSDTSDYFKIAVVDEETGRGVPLVELKTTNGCPLLHRQQWHPRFLRAGLDGQGSLLLRQKPRLRVYREA